MTKTAVYTRREIVKQFFAAALLFAISFTLTEPLFAGFLFQASTGSKLPACCRRDGKHRCQMTNESARNGHSAPAAKLERTKCSQYPSAPSSSALIKISIEPAFKVEGAPLVLLSSTRRNSFTQYRLSHSPTRQKRGPPFTV